MPQNHLKLQTNGRSSSIKKRTEFGPLKSHFSVFPEVDLWLYLFFSCDIHMLVDF